MNLADQLMAEARKADDEADEFIIRSESHDCNVNDREECIQRAAFKRGQASGFRQASFYVALHLGTVATD